ncbi:hypothetical protein VQ7734_05092 [Vibrio quintilis]|uniref:Uncharacterized protein n=1 Tax=Vibrio quintilis TaxID=1117707 RepID=A0A1M7Z2X2_9VIBR|nr:hypothetical protein VQ7734_05092 [Vibrio quintilis]
MKFTEVYSGILRIIAIMLRASLAKRFSFLSCTPQAATMRKSLAHPLPRSGLGRQTLNIIPDHIMRTFMEWPVCVKVHFLSEVIYDGCSF